MCREQQRGLGAAMRVSVFTIIIGALVWAAPGAHASDYTLTGFKSKTSRKGPPPEKVNIYVEDPDTGACKKRGAIKTEALANAMQKTPATYVGLHGGCNLAGFRFNNDRTFWFHIGNLVIREEAEWENEIKQAGPDITCHAGTSGTGYAGSATRNTSASLGFCGG